MDDQGQRSPQIFLVYNFAILQPRRKQDDQISVRFQVEYKSRFNAAAWSQGNSLVLHCASLLRTIFASSARAHERMHVQNVGDFPQTNLDNGINSPFLLNKHGDPRFFLQVFAKNSVSENIFEEEKKFDSRT